MEQPTRSVSASSTNNPYLPFVVHLADISYFSGKLEALLRYKELPFERREATVKTLLDEVYPNTELMKMPVIEMANGEWLKDTTPMFDWLEQHFPETPVIPTDPAKRFLSKLVEDYADEWCWRSAMYWRWRFPHTRQLMGNRIASEILPDWPIPQRLAAWYFGQRQTRLFLTGDGMTKETEPFIRDHYTDMLAAMSHILEDQPFLLGNRPTLVDFGLYGPMFRHFALDPAPARVMRDQAPAVMEWVGRMWNAKASKMPNAGNAQVNTQTGQYQEEKQTQGAPKEEKTRIADSPADFTHPGWQYFLQDIMQTYWPMLRNNAKAWQQGKKRMDLVTPKVTFKNLRVTHYRVYCLEVLQNEYAALPESARQEVNALLSPYGELNLLNGLESGLKDDFELPLKGKKLAVSFWKKLKLLALGTPNDKPAGK